jgi:hypothetical protein
MKELMIRRRSTIDTNQIRSSPKKYCGEFTHIGPLTHPLSVCRSILTYHPFSLTTAQRIPVPSKTPAVRRANFCQLQVEQSDFLMQL